MSSSGPIRLGLAGAGRAGWGMHVKELEGQEDRFRFVAVCDPVEAHRARMVERFGCRAYERYEDLLADAEVEMVDIATFSRDHGAHTLAALRAGKDVFLEKPIAVKASEARRIRSAAAKAKGRLYVRHNRRFETAFREIQDIIGSGRLGEVYSIKLRRGGFQRRDDWQTLRAMGGGQLLNWGPHLVDHALQFLGYGELEVWSDLKRVAAAGDAEDHVRLLLRNAAGMVVDVEISGGRMIAEPEYIVAGTLGSLRATGNEIHVRRLDPAHPRAPRSAQAGAATSGFGGSRDDLQWLEETIQADPAVRGTETDIWRHLHAAAREGAAFPVTTDEAVAVMEVVDRARRDTAFA